MKNRFGQKFWKVLLALVMLFSTFTVSAKAEETQAIREYAKVVTDLASLKTDDQVIIVNKAYKKALSQTYSGFYNAGEDVDVSADGEISNLPSTSIWKIAIDSDGNYQFMTEAGEKLSMDTSYTSMPLDKANDTWKITAAGSDVFYIENTGRPGYVMEWYSSNNNWSCYNRNTTGELFEQQIYLVTTDSTDPISDPVLATSIAIDKNELELTVGETADLKANILPANTTDKRVEWSSDAADVASVADGKVTAQKAGTATISVHTLDGSDLTATCLVTVTEAAQEDVYLEKLTEAPADGSELVIYHPTSGKALTSTASSNRLAGTDGSVTDDGLKLSEEMAVLTVSLEADGSYVFTSKEGRYLTSGATGNSLSFAADKSDYAKWTLDDKGDGIFVVVNVAAVYNGNPQALEFYNNYFTTYGVRDTDAYKFAFYGKKTIKEGLVTDLSLLEDNSKVVIYNESAAKAISSDVLSSYYLSGAEVTIADDKVIDPEEAVVWTLNIRDAQNGEGKVYTFTSKDGKKMSMNDDRNSLPLDEKNDTWLLQEAATENSYYIINENRSEYYVEWYDRYSEFSTYRYAAANENIYAMKLYVVGDQQPDDPPQPPTGEDYGLVSTIDSGDKVILYNAKNGVGLGNTLSGTRISGVSLTPSEGIITTDNTDVVWEVVRNADGTYTFTQEGKTLGGVPDGNRNNLVVTGAQASKWTLSGPDSSDFNYFLNLGELTSGYGNVYLEYYNGFTLYGSNAPDKDAYGITFYKQGAEPETPQEETGDLITDLSQLTDGAYVSIYSPGHKTAISSKPNGDWYLKAKAANVKDGKVIDFTTDFIWKVKINSDGSYSFYSYDDEAHTICVWPSGTYAEVTVLYDAHPDADNKWNLAKAKTANCFYASSVSISGTNNRGVTGPAYLEAYVRNDMEVYSGFFNTVDKLTENDFALQFYLVDPDDAIAAYDDGEWDGILKKGSAYVIYNETGEQHNSLGLFKEANYAFDAIPTTIENGKANAGNGAYVFRVDTMGRYYSFEINGRYLATNNDEELFFVDKDENGVLPENAKWFLDYKSGKDTADPDNPVDVDGYLIYNKEAQYNGTPVCIEYFSSVFSGWTYSTRNNLAIYLFKFYEVAEGTMIHEDIVQDPSVIFDCADERFIGQDFKGSFSVDDLCPVIDDLIMTYTINGVTETVPQYDFNGNSGKFVIPAENLDAYGMIDSFTITMTVKNGYGLEYSATKVITVLDEPFFEDLRPEPNTQTKDEKRPQISVKIGNAGENPVCEMYVNGEKVDAVFEDQILSWTPEDYMSNGRVSVIVAVTRQDGKSAGVNWIFTVGSFDYQLYFGQLHSHTTYSDGSGSLDTALEYIASIPESYNVQFVAFTDHSNYFDTTSAANPADAMNDKSLMTEASRKLWEEYKGKVATFNETHDKIVAIAGYEMTWSGGPGHINSFNTDGLVSRNNATLNNKTGDAGMKLYYETMNKDNGETLHQFNHPGTTFGNFTDFSYWDEETDKRMFLVEVGNGEGQIGEGGYFPSYEQYILALDNGWHVAPTNNQDNHKGRWGNANEARDVVLTNDFSEEGIYEAIRALRVYATEDKNFELTYTVNTQQMGTVYSKDDLPEEINVEITVYDPDGEDIEKVELVSDGGVVSYAWNDQEEFNEGLLAVTLPTKYNYYFVRVTQKDGDLIVSAPVWLGNVLSLGIDSVASSPDTLYKDQPVTLTTTLYNNEDKDATVTSIVYMINGSQVIGTDSTSYTLKAGQSLPVEFNTSFTEAKHTKVTVQAVIVYDGEEHTYSKDIELSIFDQEAGISKIKDVRDSSTETDYGYEFVMEGIVTSNASDFDKDTAFFDCIYIQDETGGICCFPVSGYYKIGDKVRVVGYTDYYQGEIELQVEEIEIIGEGEVSPREITASQLNDRSVEGELVTIKGTVESFEEANGMIQTIMVKDDQGNVARVFIDGYITIDYDVERLFEGNGVEATGLASYDDTWADTSAFPRIRIRDRKDIVCDDYKIIEGEDAVWTKDSGEDQLIVSNAPNDRFVGLYIDDELVDESVYSRASGSTKISLPAAYLQNLADGEHKVEIRSSDGSASTSLTIESLTPVDPDPDKPEPDKPEPDKPEPDKPEPAKPSDNTPTFRHPMTGIDSSGHFLPNERNIRKY